MNKQFIKCGYNITTDPRFQNKKYGVTPILERQLEYLGRESHNKNNKKIQIDALAKTGQLKQQKSTGQNNALSQAGALQRQRQQMGMDLVRQATQNQQKEKPTK